MSGGGGGVSETASLDGSWYFVYLDEVNLPVTMSVVKAVRPNEMR